MNHILTRVFLAGIIAIASAGTAYPQNVPPVTATAQVPVVNPVTELKKTIVFINVLCTDGNRTLQSQGTGFFVGVGSPNGKMMAAYLVTNRHVAFPKIEGKALTVLRTSVRMAKKDGSAVESALPSSLHWVVPLDDGTDLAAMGLLPSQELFDYKVLPVEMLIGPEKMKTEGVAEGQPILFAGYFKQLPGLTHLEPIVRQGIIAMIPNERIVEEGGLTGNLYLADTHAFHGNSGSPVFIDLGGLRSNGSLSPTGRYALLGVISGFFSEEAPLKAIQSSTIDSVAESNSGIATIVPAEEILGLLNSGDILLQRTAAFAARDR